MYEGGSVFYVGLLAGQDLAAKSITLTGGTVTASAPPVSASQTWNNGSITFRGIFLDITKTAAADASTAIRVDLNGSAWYRVEVTASIFASTNVATLTGTPNAFRGAVYLLDNGVVIGRRNSASSTVYIGADSATGNIAQVVLCAGGQFGFTAATADPIQGALDAYFSRAAQGIMALGKTGVGQSLSYPKGAANLTVTGTVHNLALDASAFQRLTGSSTPIVTGLAPPSGGGHADGNVRNIFNVGATAIQFNHNDTNSTAANRIYAASGANVTVSQNQRAVLFYDGTDNGSGAPGWRISPAS